MVAPAKVSNTRKVSDPNKLKRERAGRYVTGDGRFAVESQSTGTWYVVDNERQNELGLPLMQGPFETLDAARDEVEALRTGGSKSPAAPVPEGKSAGTSTRPALRSIEGGISRTTPRPAATTPASETGRTKPGYPTPKRGSQRRQPEEESAEPAWIGRLPAANQKEAHRLLALLERAGIDDPSLARRELEAGIPEIARTLLARRVQEEALGAWRSDEEDKEAMRARIRALSAGVPRHLRDEIDDALDAADRVIDGARRGADIGAFAWLVALRTAVVIFEAIDAEGREKRTTGEPGWRLVELDAKRQPTNRQITIDETHLVEPVEG